MLPQGERIQVTAVRIEGERGFVLYRDARGTESAFPVVPRGLGLEGRRHRGRAFRSRSNAAEMCGSSANLKIAYPGIRDRT